MNKHEYKRLLDVTRETKQLREEIDAIDSFLRGTALRKGKTLRLSIFTITPGVHDRGCCANMSAEVVRRSIVPALRAELRRLREEWAGLSVQVVIG